MANRNAVGCFKGEREGLIGDLSILWKQIDFLEGELGYTRNKMRTQSKKNAEHREQLDDEIKTLNGSLEEHKKELMCKDNEVLALSRKVAFGVSENRRMHHLANTKNIEYNKVKRSFAKETSNKLTKLNSQKNNSDARGDGLASDIIQMKREFTKR